MHSKLLTAEDRADIHLLLAGLPREDLALRFCAPVGAEVVERYVNKLDFDKGIFRGIYDKNDKLVAFSELAGDLSATIEFAVVVHPDMRGLGLAGKLMAQAKEDAVRHGAKELVIYCVGHNVAMVRTARSSGIPMRNHHGDMEGRLNLKVA